MQIRIGCIIIAAGLLLWALVRPVAYDFTSYAVVSGYGASQWTWLLVVAAAALAAVALFRRALARRAAAANVAAALIVATTIVWTVRGIAPRPAHEAAAANDCAGVHFKVLCKLDRALGSPYRVPESAPPRGLLIAALAGYGLAAIVALAGRGELVAGIPTATVRVPRSS